MKGMKINFMSENNLIKKTNQFLKQVSLIFLLMVIFSCDSTNPEEMEIGLMEDYYPLKIGNIWEYSHTTNSHSAIIERITKTISIHEDGSTIFGYTEALKAMNPDPNEPIVGYNTFRENGLYYYSSDKDTLFAGTNILCQKELLLKSPLIEGAKWETNGGAICHIKKVENFKLFENSYPETILVIREINMSVDSSWYAINVGLVKRVIQNSVDQSFAKWELRQYLAVK